LLLIHSDADEVIAPGMAKRLEAAALMTAAHVTVYGFEHNAPYETPSVAGGRRLWGFFKNLTVTSSEDRYARQRSSARLCRKEPRAEAQTAGWASVM
jgi:fermentation-respiration switch protein FrsA (DUF1100 family)